MYDNDTSNNNLLSVGNKRVVPIQLWSSPTGPKTMTPITTVRRETVNSRLTPDTDAVYLTTTRLPSCDKS